MQDSSCSIARGGARAFVVETSTHSISRRCVAAAAVFHCWNLCRFLYRLARANFHWRGRRRISILDLATVPDRRTRLLVLSLQTGLAGEAHFHLSAMAD